VFLAVQHAGQPGLLDGGVQLKPGAGDASNPVAAGRERVLRGWPPLPRDQLQNCPADRGGCRGASAAAARGGQL